MKLKVSAFIFLILLTACMPAGPLTFKAVGLIDNKPAIVEVTREAPIRGTKAKVSINGEEILVTRRQTVITSNPNCERLSLYAYRCFDEAIYNGKKIRVVEEWNANMQIGYAHFDIYLDDRLIQRVEANGGF